MRLNLKYNGRGRLTVWSEKDKKDGEQKKDEKTTDTKPLEIKPDEKSSSAETVTEASKHHGSELLTFMLVAILIMILFDMLMRSI